MKNEIKLNLGSGTDYIEGWTNVDVADNAKVDVKADLSNDFPFKSQSVSEIKAFDILEHFTKEDGLRFLKECNRVLQTDGKIIIRTPHVFQIIHQFQDDPDVMIHFLYGNTHETGIFGAHKYAYTEETLSIVLRYVGFRIDHVQTEDTNFIVTAKKEREGEVPLLKIAVIQQSPDIGGAEVHMANLLRNFAKKGNTVYLSTNNQTFADMSGIRKNMIDKIPVVLDVIGNLRGFIKSIFLLLFAFIFYISILIHYKRKKVDVILMSGFTEKLFVSALSLLFRIPVVWIEYADHGPIFSRNLYIPKMLYRLVKGIPKAVIVPTKYARDALIQSSHVSLAKIHVIPCGVSFQKNKKTRSKTEEHEGKFVIGTISRLTLEKGQYLLIEAMPEILKKVKNVHLLIVGDGPDRKKLEDLVRKLHLKEHVSITGFVKDTSIYYRQMNLFVFPTIWDLEGFGLVVVEAMKHKVPVVANAIGPLPYIIDTNKNGVLIDIKDQKQVVDTIVYLSKNTKKRKKLAKYAFEKASKQYDINNTSEEILHVLYTATLSSDTGISNR